MAKKKIAYRGLEIEELQAKSMEELVKIMPSRSRRSLKRGFSEIQKKLLGRVKQVRKDMDAGKKVKPIRTECRDMIVLPDMVGMEFEIYNGKEFLKILIDIEMLGQYLGEFSLSRKPVKHSAPGIGATRSSLFVPVK